MSWLPGTQVWNLPERFPKIASGTILENEMECYSVYPCTFVGILTSQFLLTFKRAVKYDFLTLKSSWTQLFLYLWVNFYKGKITVVQILPTISCRKTLLGDPCGSLAQSFQICFLFFESLSCMMKCITLWQKESIKFIILNAFYYM